MVRTWLKEKREKKGYSENKTAELSKISQGYYSMIENGKRDLKPDVAMRIADVLGFYWGKFYER